MDLIDSHCHFEKFHQRGEVGAIIARAAELGVNRFINIGTSLDDWALYRDLAREHPGKLFWTAGLHPCHVEEDWRDHVTALSTYWTDDPAPVALGEIGLDNFHLPKYPDEAAFFIPQCLEDKVQAGDLGRKTGKGFYHWDGDKRGDPVA